MRLKNRGTLCDRNYDTSALSRQRRRHTALVNFTPLESLIKCRKEYHVLHDTSSALRRLSRIVMLRHSPSLAAFFQELIHDVGILCGICVSRMKPLVEPSKRPWPRLRRTYVMPTDMTTYRGSISQLIVLFLANIPAIIITTVSWIESLSAMIKLTSIRDSNFLWINYDQKLRRPNFISSELPVIGFPSFTHLLHAKDSQRRMRFYKLLTLRACTKLKTKSKA